ncbi:MAG: recombination mediator RecR [Clostridiales bacterium]|nr:recombination mediator RecR [Clostridiales bacterium]
MSGFVHAPVMQELMKQFGKLPGIGPKTAQRLAFFVLSLPEEEVGAFSEAMVKAKETMTLCPVCYSLTDVTPCQVCRDGTRDRQVICVVEETSDVFSVERAREYRGLYHVLHGSISPMENRQPEDLKIKELLSRLEGENGVTVREVILATNPDVEGETTALYLARILKPLGIKTTRIAHGIPVGSNLEHADAATLAQALEGRRDID